MCSHPLKEKRMLLRLEDLEGLNLRQRRQKLLERMASSEAGRRKFWKKVNKSGPDDCWPWTGMQFNDGDGYGLVALCVGPNGKCKKYRFRTHRVAFFLTHNFLPDDLCVCHKCDNPICANPAHLFLGTPRQNAYDRNDKERDARGEGHGMHKLTTEEVKEIRHLRKVHKLPYSALGLMFGVSTTQAGFIVRRESWKHLK